MSFIPKFVHFYMVPFTGLGLHNGYRGDRWLKNRIKIFNTFVLPSLLSQGSRDFYCWFCWRPEEKENPIVKEFIGMLDKIEDFFACHTFHGIPFWDDKYPDGEAEKRLRNTLEKSLPELKNHVGEIPYVLVTIQPSDDMYLSSAAKEIKSAAGKAIGEGKRRCAIGWKTGYIMNYQTKEISEYLTDSETWIMDKAGAYRTGTTPPFFTILYSSRTFLDPKLHYDHIGPYKSHEFIEDIMEYIKLEGRGFIVGCHGENISTAYNHRYRGRVLTEKEAGEIMIKAGIYFSEPIKFKPSTRMKIRGIVNRLPLSNLLKKLYYLLPSKLRII